MKALALIAVLLLVGACTRASSTVPASVDAPAPPVIETTAQPSALAASVQPADAWGPLAVRPPEDSTDTARAEGTLRITDSCVYLDAAGGLTLLTWPADRTTWSGASQAITFANFDGTVATIGDGEHVVLGGGGDSAAESGISGEDWVNGRDWVVPPASSCSLDSRWAVGIVEDSTTAVATIAPASPTLSAPPSSSPSSSVTPLGSVRIPFANREMEVTIIGAPGIVVAWRAASDQDLEEVAWDGDTHIAFSRLSERDFVLGWIGTVCDVTATLTVAPGQLTITPVPRQGCDAMAVGRAVVLTFAEPADPAVITVVLGDTVLLPETS